MWVKFASSINNELVDEENDSLVYECFNGIFFFYLGTNGELLLIARSYRVDRTKSCGSEDNTNIN